jgi:Tfp pilus assembly protein PilF
LKSSYVVFGATGTLVLVGALFFRPAASADVPRTPKSDAEVLERLPLGRADPREREQERLRRVLASQPQDLRAATALAQLDIELSRARSDPRFLSYAQAALAPWWEMPAPPLSVRVLRATIRQSVHDFDRALADLDEVVRLDPTNAQAWITRSVVLGVKGRYAEAKASCEPLKGLAPELVLAVCESSIDAVNGAAGPAYERLAGALARTRGVSVAEHEWATSTLGEIALRLGKDDLAEEQFKAALAEDPGDSYVLAAYADLLLDLGRAAEATDLVAAHTDNDGLLLRLVLADARTHAKQREEHLELLRGRFDASRLRGDTVHRREEARFVLAAGDDPKRALELATANWGVQREPWDVRVLLESALAARDPSAAEPALSFLAATHLEDPRIRALAARIGKP